MLLPIKNVKSDLWYPSIKDKQYFERPLACCIDEVFSKSVPNVQMSFSDQTEFKY